MATQIQLEVDEQTAKAIDQAAAAEGMDRAAWLRNLLNRHVPPARTEPKKTPWELGKHVFGKYGSGRTDLSENAEQIVREKIHAKHAKNRRV